MNNLERMHVALDFVEEHLTENILLGDVASTVNLSEFHFHRMFRFITGYSLKDYIRRRRLYLAAVDIVDCVDSLVNIAHKYQFSSQSSFTVAFKKMHGMTPGELSKSKGNYKMFVRMIPRDFELMTPEGLSESPEIIEVKSFTVLGFKCDVKTSQLMMEDNPVSQIWKLLKVQPSYINDMDSREIVAVYEYDPKELFSHDTVYTYILGYKSGNQDSFSDDMIEKVIPSSRYLKFQLNPAKCSHIEAYNYIDGKWLPKSEYILSEYPDFEIYRKGDGIDMVDIYISIED